MNVDYLKRLNRWGRGVKEKWYLPPLFRIANMPRIILRNISSILTHRALDSAAYLALTMFISRELGSVGLGQYTFAFSSTSLLFLFLSFGVGDLLIREVARKPESIRDVVGSYIPFQILSWVPGAIGLGLIFFLRDGGSSLIFSLIIIASFISLILRIDGAFRVGFWGREEIHYECLSGTISTLLGISIALLLLLQGFGVMAVLVSLLLGTVLGLCLSSVMFLKRFGKPELRIQVRRWLGWTMSALPFFVNSLLLIALLQLDMVMVGFMMDEWTVGIFGSAFLITKHLTSALSVLAKVFYPRLSSLWSKKDKQFFLFLRKGKIIMGVVILMIVSGTSLLSEPILVVVFGSDFSSAAPVLRILLIATFFWFLLTYDYFIFCSTDRVWRPTAIFVTAFLMNFASNLILGRWWGIVGIASGTLMAYVFAFLLSIPLRAHFKEVPTGREGTSKPLVLGGPPNAVEGFLED